MSREELIQVLSDAYYSCIVGGSSKEYNMGELIVEVGTVKELKVINPGIYMSMALKLDDGRAIICLAKEDIIFAPEEYRLKALIFIALHELGHIVNGDEWEEREEENTIQEKRADTYAMINSGMAKEDGAKVLEFLYQPYFNKLETVQDNEQKEYLLGVLTRMKAARIDNILKNKGCA